MSCSLHWTQRIPSEPRQNIVMEWVTSQDNSAVNMHRAHLQKDTEFSATLGEEVLISFRTPYPHSTHCLLHSPLIKGEVTWGRETY
jgi:hypothetical protein